MSVIRYKLTTLWKRKGRPDITAGGGGGGATGLGNVALGTAPLGQ